LLFGGRWLLSWLATSCEKNLRHLFPRVVERAASVLVGGFNRRELLAIPGAQLLQLLHCREPVIE
jgi:hypothetical protein